MERGTESVKKSQKMISIVCVLPKEQTMLASWLTDIEEIVLHSFEHCEFVLIDNGDFHGRKDELLKATGVLRHFKVLSLSQKNDSEIAMTAGIEHSIGDYVVVMTAGEHPPALIPKMVDLIEAGVDYVIGEQQAPSNASLSYRLFSKLFFKVGSKLLDSPIDNHWSNFICLSRDVSNAIVKVKKRVRFLRLIGKEIGFSHALLPFAPLNESGNAKKLSLERVLYGMQILVSNTDKLLQLASVVSFSVVLIDLIYILYSFFIWVFLSSVQSGWTSTSMFLSIMFGLIFFVLGILCQYVSLICRESIVAPLYYISCESGSSECDLFRDFSTKNVE